MKNSVKCPTCKTVYDTDKTAGFCCGFDICGASMLHVSQETLPNKFKEKTMKVSVQEYRNLISIVANQLDSVQSAASPEEKAVEVERLKRHMAELRAAECRKLMESDNRWLNRVLEIANAYTTTGTVPTPTAVPMMVPDVHMNGTHRDELVDGYQNTANALALAFQRAKQSAPNGRDYYTKGPEAMKAATEQHESRLRRIDALKTEFETLAMLTNEAPGR